MPVIANVKEETDFAGEVSKENSEEKKITLEDNAVSFRLGQEEPGVTYMMKAAGGEYIAAEPGRTYYISDMLPEKAYAREFTIKAETAEDHSVNPDINIYFDTVKPERFKLLEVENYAPRNLSAMDKLNYKTS